MMKVQDQTKAFSVWEGKTGTVGGPCRSRRHVVLLRGVFAAPFVPRIIECAGDRIYLSHSFLNDGEL
jgi:hypothetical protein